MDDFINPQNTYFCSRTNSWLIPKRELGVLIEHASKDTFREELNHIAFTSHSILATDGHRLVKVAQKGRSDTGFETFSVVHRDVLIRAQRAVLKPSLERVIIRVVGEYDVQIQRWDRVVDTRKTGDIVARFGPGQEIETSTPRWGWPKSTNEILGDVEKRRGRSDILNPEYFDSMAKSYKAMGFGSVEVFFGRKKEDIAPTIFRGKTRSGGYGEHSLEVTMVVMGMKV